MFSRLREANCLEIKLWDSYFSHRSASVIGTNDIVYRDVVRDCSQRSTCGPFKWNIIMNPLLIQLGGMCGEDEGLLNISAYADDLLVLAKGQSWKSLEVRSEVVMTLFTEWGNNVGVKVSPEKTVTMLFNASFWSNRPPVIRVNGPSWRY